MSRAFTLLLLAGCAERRARFEETLPTPGLAYVAVESERGLLRYDGRGADDVVEVTGVSWARGLTGRAADRKQRESRWERTVDGELLLGAVSTEARSAGMDLTLRGPEQVDVELFVHRGEARLVGVDGIHRITADRVVARDVRGAVDLFAGKHGLEAAIDPEPGSYSLLQSYGDDLVLRLPEGGDYTIEAFGDASHGVTVRDLGFTELYQGLDYVVAVSGTGETHIEAFVTGGAFYLFAAD